MSENFKRSPGELKLDGSTGLPQQVIDSAAPSQSGKYFIPPPPPIPVAGGEGSTQGKRSIVIT